MAGGQGGQLPAEPNYFVHFAMRYPVDRIDVLLDKLQAHFAKIGRNDMFYIIVQKSNSKLSPASFEQSDK